MDAEMMPARWYCVKRDGLAMPCADEDDARATAAECDALWPKEAPHRAVWLGDVAAALNLWPRDCRLCAHYGRESVGCTSPVQCVDSLQFRQTPPLQYWRGAQA